MKLSTIRKSRSLTQLQVAHRLGVDQSVVSRIENGTNMLLSTLLEYLAAAGAEDTRIVTRVGGHDVELDLAVTAHSGRHSRREGNARPTEAQTTYDAPTYDAPTYDAADAIRTAS
jgi:transcriptional regulator with XRE-family HTH domain